MWATEVQLVANAELTDQHQPYFASAGAQEGWFLKDVVRTISTATQLNSEFKIQLNGSYEDNLAVNVVTWINHDLGGKRMYARVVQKDWINTNVTLFTVRLDAFQTWMFDIDVRGCFVEREMQEDDWNGSTPSYNNLVPEPISVSSEPIVQESIDVDYNQQVICALATNDTQGRPIGGTIVNGVYNAGQWYVSPSAGEINALITGYDNLGLADGIPIIFMCPNKIYNNVTETIQLPSGSQGGGLSGYQPQNAKLYSYPFHYAVVSNQQGQTEEYRFENYNGPAPTQLVFNTRNAFSANPQAMIYPADYKGRVNNFDEGVILNVDAPCVWSSDTYSNWYAQNGQSQFIKGLGSALAVAGGVATGNPLAIAAGGLGFASTTATDAEMQWRPSKMRGSFASATANIQFASVGFLCHRVALKADEAERIDKYFDAFGYATMTTKVPNLRTRPYWNYVKTRNSCVQGTFAQEWIDDINNMFNRGVTLWHVDAGAQIGNYDMDNRG